MTAYDQAKMSASMLGYGISTVLDFIGQQFIANSRRNQSRFIISMLVFSRWDLEILMILVSSSESDNKSTLLVRK